MSRLRVRRRGAVYIAVLGTTLLVVSIGLGSLAVARARMVAATHEVDGLRAREVAEAGLDFVLGELAADVLWRKHPAGDPWVDGLPFAGGALSVRLEDPEDGDLADDSTDPVLVRIEARAGVAVRRFEAVVDLRRRVLVLEPRAAAPNTISVIDSLVTGEGELRSAGPIVASNAEVQLNAVSGESVSGSTFEGLNRVEPISGVFPAFSDLDGLWGTDATAIAADALPLGGAPLPGWDLGVESGAGDWLIDSEGSVFGVIGCGLADEASVEGGCMLRVGDRWFDWEGAYIDLTDTLNAGTKPRMRVRVRLRDPIDGPVSAHLVLRYRYRRPTFLGWWYSGEFIRYGESKELQEDWEDLEVSAEPMSWSLPWQVDYAWVDVETPGSVADHLIDEGRLYDSAADAVAPLLLHRVRLGPDSNPFGTANPEGRYVIDLAGRDLVIRDCAIEGTLILRNAGDGTRIEGAVSWQPVTPGDPIVIVQGNLTVAPNGEPLQEQTIGVDLDGDGQRSSTLPAILDGIIFARGRLAVQGRPVFGGSLLSRNGMFFENADARFVARAGDPDRVPPGFTVDEWDVVVRPGTLRTIGIGGGN